MITNGDLYVQTEEYGNRTEIVLHRLYDAEANFNMRSARSSDTCIACKGPEAGLAGFVRTSRGYMSLAYRTHRNSLRERPDWGKYSPGDPQHSLSDWG